MPAPPAETPPPVASPPGPPGTPTSHITPISIEDEMRHSYLDYAMSVIIGRAIPDVRDGLKPVHRRILYAMLREGLVHTHRYVKCAGIVGEVLKKFHPHGDAAVYDSLVRLAQDWNMRYRLVDGQGNFGSVDGDPPAAYRYTEARLTQLAEAILADIDADTVDFVANYDDSTTEPVVLPARFPNLLVNGAAGIAVGMATNVPPHNLREVTAGVVHLIRNPQATVDDLMKLIPGPDFPTGGFIYGRAGIEQAYRTGRGLLNVRARVSIETAKKDDRETIVVHEIPYQVNKAKLLERIAELSREKRIDGVATIRDGMRIVIELKRDAVSQVVLNQLYKLTPMQETFGVNNLAIVAGRPQVLDLRQTLQSFVDHRREVTTRRCRYDLTQAEARLHILEGLRIALDNIDAILDLIKKAASPTEANEGLQEKFELSEKQATAILEMRLQRLTGLERDKILAEHAEVLKTIERLKALLADDPLLMDLVVEELQEVCDKHADDRRTEIVDESIQIEAEDLIAEEDMVVTVSHLGYIKRNPVTAYRAQRRGGRGVTGMDTREEDFVNQIFVASTHSHVLYFSDRGKVYSQKVHEIPQASRTARGKAIVNLVGMTPGEKVAAVVPIREFQEGMHVVTATKLGYVKKTNVMQYSNIRQSGIIGVGLDEGDALLGAVVTDGTRELLIGSRAGMSIRFPESQVRPMGRPAHGVKGIGLRESDAAVGMAVLDPHLKHVLTVCDQGFGKRSDVEEHRQQHRGGVGIITIKTSERNGPVVSVRLVGEDDHLMVMTDRGKVIRTKVREIPVQGRNTQGVRIIRLEEGERVVAVERLAEPDEREDRDERGSAEGPDPSPVAIEPSTPSDDNGASEGEGEDDGGDGSGGAA